MSALFTATDNDSVSATFTAGVSSPFGVYPIGITFFVTVSGNPAGKQTICYIGQASNSSNYIEVYITATGLVGVWDRGNGLTAVETANAVLTDGSVNVITVTLDKLSTTSGKPRARIKLNGGSVATFNDTTHSDANCATWDKFGYGGLLRTSSPLQYFDGTIEQAFFFIPPGDSTDFDDHDTLWNSGSPLDPSGETINETHRYPFDNTSGIISGTDTYIDDAVDSLDLNTVGGSPIYVASIFEAEDPGSQTGAFSSCTINTPRTATLLFDEPAGYHWNASFTENSAKRPIFTVTSPKPGGGTDTRAVGVNAIKSVGLNGTQLEVVVYTDAAIKNGDTVTVACSSGWYTDVDADITGTVSNSATNSVGAGFTWPKPIMRWAHVPYRVVAGQDYLEATCFHRWGMDSLVFKQSTTTLATLDMTVPATAWSKSSRDSAVVLRAAVNAANYADGLTEFDIVGTPLWGGSDTIRNTATDSTILSFSLYCNSGGSLTTSSYWVDSVNGNDTTGDGSQSTPYATIAKAVTVWKSAGTNRFVIYCMAGTYTYSADLTNPTDCDTWGIIAADASASRSEVIIETVSKDLGVQRVCYRNVTLDYSSYGVSESQTFGGNSALWVDSCVVSGDGQQSAEAGGAWFDTRTGAWDEVYVTDTAINDIPARGAEKPTLIRNCTIQNVQETGIYDPDLALLTTATGIQKYTGSSQHVDGISWFVVGATDRCGIVQQCQVYDVTGQPVFFGQGFGNIAIVASVFVQTTDGQYLSDFGKNSTNDDVQHLVLEGVTLANGVLSCSSASGDTDTWQDVIIRNCVASQFNLTTSGSGADGYDITCDECHGIDAQQTSRYATGTQTTGDPGFVNGSTGNYNASQTDYTPDPDSLLVNRISSLIIPFDVFGTLYTEVGSIGAVQAAEPFVSSISPTSIAIGETADITITGTGFIDGIEAISNNPGAFTVNSTVFNSSTEVVVSITGEDGTAGNYVDAITLTNPDGQADSFALTLSSISGGSGVTIVSIGNTRKAKIIGIQRLN